MWTMSRRRFMNWEKLRLRGRRYVILRTALFATVVLFVVINFGFWIVRGNPVSSNFFFLFPALGLAFGLIAWSINENRFADFIANKKSQAEATRKRRKK